MRLDNKVAIVTGSGRGIGEAIVYRFIEEGAKVTLCDVDESALKVVASKVDEKNGACLLAVGDIADRDFVGKMVDNTIKEFGTLDVMVNNAAITRDAILHKMTQAQWEEVMDVNLKGTFNCLQAAATYMRSQGKGTIINVSSTSRYGNVGQLNYAASKGGVVAMTRTAAKELCRKNVTCNCISPGTIWTDMLKAVPEQGQERLKAGIPLGRFGEPKEVAHLAVFLASDEASYITGQTINCDGVRLWRERWDPFIVKKQESLKMAMEIDLSGKVAVVTGAGRGIGKSTAIALAEAGADVVLAARTLSQLEEAALQIRSKGRRALPIQTDVTQKESVENLMSSAHDQMGGLHILVNNAAIMAPAPLMEQTEEAWDRVLAVNLKAVFLCTQSAGHYMIKKQYGKVINMASTGGVIAGPRNASYHASKAAIIHFTRSVAIEWIRYNINVNAVGPGMVDTELVDQFIQGGKRETILKGIPIRRFADPQEIANLVAFLASDLSNYMVGEHVIIDGGLTIP